MLVLVLGLCNYFHLGKLIHLLSIELGIFRGITYIIYIYRVDDIETNNKLTLGGDIVTKSKLKMMQTSNNNTPYHNHNHNGDTTTTNNHLSMSMSTK